MLFPDTLTTSFVSGIFDDVAWKNGMVIFAMNVPSPFVRLTMSLWPLAWTPETLVPWPLLTAEAPTMFVPVGSVMNCAPGDARSWLAVRLMAYLKLAAVTGVPSLNLKPFRMKNVYLFPPFETVK